MKIALIRLDKIGDLVSTMPVDQSDILKSSEVLWVIAKGMGFVAENAEPKRKYIELNKSDWMTSFSALLDFLKKEKPDVAVSFQAPWWVNVALWLARIKIRAGVLSQWHSFLFLNKGLRQKRSLAAKHEADYNTDLLYFALDLSEKRKNEIRQIQTRYPSPVLKMHGLNHQQVLEKFNLLEQKYVVVHPGMMGSARNWPSQNYVKLIQKITQFQDLEVVITGTQADEDFVRPLRDLFSINTKVKILQNHLNSSELLTVLEKSLAVVAPSTGVLHLAAAVQTTAIGIYSPIRVQTATRWAARGLDVKIFEPKVHCPEAFACIQQKCPHWDCMASIEPDEIMAEIKGLL